MAVLNSSNAFLTQEINNLESIITQVGVQETPLLSILMARGQVSPMSGIKVVWREESYDDNGTTPAGVKEGAEHVAGSKGTRTTRENTAQIFSKSVEVTGTAAAIAANGGADGITALMAREMERRSIEIKKDLERSLFLSTEKAEDGSSGRQMNGLLNLVVSEHTIDAESGKITKALIRDAVKKQWAAGSRGEKIMFLNSDQKDVIDDLYEANAQQMYNVQLQVGANAFGVSCTKIHTAYGDLILALSTDIPQGTVLIANIADLELKRLRGFHTVNSGDGRDAEKQTIIGEYSVICRNRHSLTKIINLATEEE